MTTSPRHLKSNDQFIKKEIFRKLVLDITGRVVLDSGKVLQFTESTEKNEVAKVHQNRAWRTL